MAYPYKDQYSHSLNHGIRGWPSLRRRCGSFHWRQARGIITRRFKRNAAEAGTRLSMPDIITPHRAPLSRCQTV